MNDASVLQVLDDVSPAEGGARVRVRRARRSAEVSLVDGARARKISSIIYSPKLMVSAAIVRPSRVFRLRGTFVIDSQQLDDGTVFVRHRDLPVFGYGETFRDAFAGFQEMFEHQWAALVEAPAEELEESALAVREQLRQVVEAVVPRQ